MPQDNRLVNVVEVAEYLACSERHVWNLIARGDLPAYRLGAITRLRVDDLRAYVDANRAVAT
jgi:excisionase family DNA binding protein